MPVLRVPDECAYYKEDAGKMMLGAFEPEAKPWGMDGIPEDFEFDQLPEDVDHFEPILEAIHRMPMLAEAGIHTFFNGPESFTPDDAYHLGLVPGLDNFWVAAGFNSIGIQSAGGAGMALAQWMTDGEKPFDLGDVDIARMQPFQRNRRYLRERVDARRWACSMPIISPIARRRPRGACGARRFTRIFWSRRGDGRDGRLGARQLVRPPDRRGATAIPGAGRTGSTTPPPSTARCARGWASTTCPPSARSASRGRTPNRSSTASRAGDMSVPEGRIVYTQFLNATRRDRGRRHRHPAVGDRLSGGHPCRHALADQTWLERHRASTGSPSST